MSTQLERARTAARFGRVSAEGVGQRTPMGANLVPGGATFRVWAPQAIELHVRVAESGGEINEPGDRFTPDESTRLIPLDDGHWAGFVSGVRDGDHYRFYVVGEPQPYVRDPYARELEFFDWPDVDCIVRDPHAYPWHDQGYRPRPFHEWSIYQLHFGTWHAADADGHDERANRVGCFLDAVERIPHLAQLGVTHVQPLPVTEFNSVPNPFDEMPRSLGYNGTDLFSPEMDYGVPPARLPRYLEMVNRMLAEHGRPPLSAGQLEPQVNQLKVFVDLCRLHGIGVLFDVVYNHAGGFDGDDQNLFHFRDADGGHLYFQRNGWAGGLVFQFGSPGVRQFLINNARQLIDEYHLDGLRHDEVTVTDSFGGWSFCQDLTGTLKHHRPEALQHAEYWRSDPSWVVRPRESGGAGYDSVLYPGLRDAIRSVIRQAAAGGDASVNLDGLRDALRTPPGLAAQWRAVQHLESHDRQRVQNTNDREPRIVALADANDRRSWYARSRARVANGLLLTAPGLPMLLMGQEFLEDKYWTDDPDNHPGNLIWWDGLKSDSAMSDHLAYVSELLRLRRRHPALCGEPIHPFYVHNANRVLAFHRWLEGEGRDVVVVASLRESPWESYELGFPGAGTWWEVLNSDHFDQLPNPRVVGNWGRIEADGPPRDDLPASARLRIPANGLLVFARERH